MVVIGEKNVLDIQYCVVLFGEEQNIIDCYWFPFVNGKLKAKTCLQKSLI